ncbi:MAG: hypothetical protein IPJ81_02820 [Chitinophagaceae bacterium]|nr:hypothetical protein [Chitinophagaceae bacterium]
MRVAVLSTDELYNELAGQINTVEWLKANDWQQFIAIKDADVYFNLSENAGAENYLYFTAAVFINAVTTTLKEMNAPGNVCGVLAWPGFLQRNTWEISGDVSKEHIEILNKLNKTYIQVADEPGMVSGKIISMVINEAYFALEDEVSTKEEIDIAMKLGTNYPYGPFEWSKKIGLNNIYTLLQKLSTTDKRYTPSSLLIKEAAAL